ncbi:hypothetical protein IC614_11535 [Allosphingosinicella flava]|uniref:DUF4352 domain-containing protein n=1 Tax=Allosphingosinicella flava TaxID=2771430 RepID=A0A7T2GJB2_9SPHN|nr:hypothetical protein [Sphingosinicella flava]QPQ54927.1 hypothetical protein IC614_11535 [Sphingosinicella flava]
MGWRVQPTQERQAMTFTSSLFSAAAAAALLAAATPAAAGISPSGTIEGVQKVTNAAYEGFPTFAFSISSFGAASDGHYQMVVDVINKGKSTAGLTASELKVTLLNERDESRVNWGELYDGKAIGPSGSFPPIQDTIKLGPGEKAKIKLGFPNTKGFKPKKLILQDVDSKNTVTYAISN